MTSFNADDRVTIDGKDIGSVEDLVQNTRPALNHEETNEWFNSFVDMVSIMTGTDYSKNKIR